MTKKTGLFTGCGDVFSFTFLQNAKGKGYLFGTIGIGVVVLALFIIMNVLMGASSSDDSDSSKDNYVETPIEHAYVINDSGLSNLDLSIYKGYGDNAFPDTEFEYTEQSVNIKEYANSVLDKDKRAIVVNVVKNEDGSYSLESYIGQDGVIDSDEASQFLDTICTSFESYKLTTLSLNEDSTILLNSGIYSEVKKATADDKSVGETIMTLFAPMLCCLLLYMMVLLYGQSISNSVVSEKTSKLMETLLTSVKPYSVIFGKISALIVSALIQMFVWISCGIAGFIIGDKIAESQHPGYSNLVLDTINLVKSTRFAFSASAIVLAILAVVLGFAFYCVLAGFVASNISKTEDLGNANGIFTIPVIIGFLGSYLAPVMEVPVVTVIFRYFPLTSAFSLAGDVIVGNVNAIEAVISLAILAVTTLVLIMFTGLIYKKKVFSRS